jgi:hypothetical protein
MPPDKLRSTRIAVCMGLAMLLASCQLRARLLIADGSTADKLTFIVSAWSDNTPGKLDSAYVTSCVDRPGQFPAETTRVWAASAKTGADRPSAGRFSYGNVPGLTNNVEAKPLAPGCYVARVNAYFPDPRGAWLVFHITSSGAITTVADT